MGALLAGFQGVDGGAKRVFAGKKVMFQIVMITLANKRNRNCGCWNCYIFQLCAYTVLLICIKKGNKIINKSVLTIVGSGKGLYLCIVKRLIDCLG